MKKKSSALVSAILCMSLVGCGTPSAGVPQDEYDALQAQYESLQGEYDDLQSDYNSMASELDAANEEIEALLSTADKAGVSGGEDAAPVDVLVHEDDYVEIRFIGCELDDDDQELVFMVSNKTDSELTFQSGTMAIDGWSLGYVSGSDSIAAQSKGKVRFETKEDFPTMSPETISGTISVIDFGKTLWDSMSYDVAFSELDVTQ